LLAPLYSFAGFVFWAMLISDFKAGFAPGANTPGAVVSWQITSACIALVSCHSYNRLDWDLIAYLSFLRFPF